eukprot:357031_1
MSAEEKQTEETEHPEELKKLLKQHAEISYKLSEYHRLLTPKEKDSESIEYEDEETVNLKAAQAVLSESASVGYYDAILKISYQPKHMIEIDLMLKDEQKGVKIHFEGTARRGGYQYEKGGDVKRGHFFCNGGASLESLENKLCGYQLRAFGSYTNLSIDRVGGATWYFHSSGAEGGSAFGGGKFGELIKL